MVRLVQEEGKLIVHDVPDCDSEQRGRARGKLLLTAHRYVACYYRMKPFVEVKFDEPCDEAAFPWRLQYQLADRWAEHERHQDVTIDMVELRFKTEAGRGQFEGYVDASTKKSDVELCLEAKFYDIRMFNLCIMLPHTWLTNRDNAWQLAGFFHRRPHVDRDAMMRTYVCVVAKTRGYDFDLEAALKAFDSWSNPKWKPKLTEGMIKSIVGGAIKAGYEAWKKACTRNGGVVEELSDIKDFDDPKKLKAERFDAINEELAQLPKDLFLADNEYFMKDLAKQRDWADYKTLAYAIKSSYAYVLNGQNAIFLKKMAVMEHFGANDSVRTIHYEQASIMAKKAAEATQKFRVQYKGDKPVEVNLCETLIECWRGIAYDDANVIPHSAKEPRTMDDTFNMFGMYQHVYDPDFKIDMELVSMYTNHIKEILCNGDNAVGEYVLNCLAHILQKPHIKTTTVPLFKSKQGAGKNFISNVYSRYVLNPSMSAVVADMDKLLTRTKNLHTNGLPAGMHSLPCSRSYCTMIA
ncbi:unnamed protein product [Phytophthora fragariaefolia]|uniref:Unnamed protein product n=1 Tax=Phytophthora fragariaefolia TaxID=1490495 RepID=A0A9W6X1N3_9STRA|nr:unnamed protein product [Phytophthora fragariaefolia]